MRTAADRRAQNHAHTALVKSIILDLARVPGLLLWEHKSGRFREPFSERHVDVGLVGSPDIIGFLDRPDAPFAIFIGLEVKTGEAVLSGDQRSFHAVAASKRAFRTVVRSVEDAREAIEKARGAT
jgi:hypothetical protein